MTAPQKSESPVAAGQVAEHRKEDAHILATPAPDDKRFATLAAKFALAGHGLIRNAPGDGQAPYVAMRWGLMKPLPDLDAAEAFLRQIGGDA